jgi:hypothetical protein
MQIKPQIYENLTAQQRLIATIEAEARHDRIEVIKLVKSCPKMRYMQNDAAYSEQMQGLMLASAAVALDLSNNAIDLLIAKEHGSDIMPTIGTMASIRDAWHLVLKERGFDPVSVEKAFMPQHQLIERLLDGSISPLPMPDSEVIALYAQALREHLDEK